VATLGDDTVVNALTCVAFVAVATWVTYRGVEATKRVQYVLVGSRWPCSRCSPSWRWPRPAPHRAGSRSSCPGSTRPPSPPSAPSPPGCPCRCSSTGAGTPA
jgi:hypothetical protein